MESLRTAWRQAPGLGSAVVAATLRASSWQAFVQRKEAAENGERGHAGSAAGSAKGPTRQRTERNPARHAVAPADSHPGRGVERATHRLSGGGQRGSLRVQSGRGFHLEFDLYRPGLRLDRGARGLEQRIDRRARTNAR